MQQRTPDEDAGGHGVQAAEHGGTRRGDAGHAFEEGVGVADVLRQQKRQRREDAHNDPTADRQQVHVPRAQVNMLWPALAHQCQPGYESDQARPQKRRHVGGAVEDHQGDHRHHHGDGQGNQEDADNETDDAEGRQRHAVALIRK